MSAVMDPPKVLKGNPGVMVPMHVKTPAGDVLVEVAPEVAAEPLKFAKLIEAEVKDVYEEMKKQQEAAYEVKYKYTNFSFDLPKAPPLPPPRMLADLKQRALEWVNAIRTEWDLPALDRLPRGYPGNGQGCVLARALPHARSVGTRVLLESGSYLVPPLDVQRFIHFFDRCAYPELVA